MAKSAMLILGLLFVFAVLQFQDVAAETYGSTDSITFKFDSDEATAEAPSDDDTVAESFWSEVPAPADDSETTTVDESSFAEAPEDESTATESLVEEEDPESVVFATDADGVNSTLVDEDGFDVVEDSDDDSTTE